MMNSSSVAAYDPQGVGAQHDSLCLRLKAPLQVSLLCRNLR